MYDFRSSFSISLGRPPTSSLFPYTTLFRSLQIGGNEGGVRDRSSLNVLLPKGPKQQSFGDYSDPRRFTTVFLNQDHLRRRGSGDRKSTRLNSSHRCISYAVFCLKKKKKHLS